MPLKTPKLQLGYLYLLKKGPTVLYQIYARNVEYPLYIIYSYTIK